jgi:hypothetical protein
MAKKPTKRKAAPKMSFNERVRKVIQGEAETKMKVVNIFSDSDIKGVGLTTTTAPVGGLTQANLLETLAIAQGPEQEEREGNKIQNCKLKVRGVIQSDEYRPNSNAVPNSSPYPFEVHMVFYKLKKDIDNNNQSLKVLPNNNTGEVDGTLINSVYPYNKDRYIIRKIRVFRMRPLMGSSNPAGQTTNTQYSNAPAFHRFVETIDIHKELKFNDQATAPANDWCGVSLFVINGDGDTLTATTTRAKVTMDAVITYKDI